MKTRWDLDVDPAEKNALQRIAAGCANDPITVQIARTERHPGAQPRVAHRARRRRAL